MQKRQPKLLYRSFSSSFKSLHSQAQQHRLQPVPQSSNIKILAIQTTAISALQL